MPLEDLSSKESGLKIMWWNVGCSSGSKLDSLTEDDRISIDPKNQWRNLTKLVQSDRLRPDVLILGEFCPSRFDEETYEAILAKFDHEYRLDKINEEFTIRNGFRAFSKYEIKDLEEGVLEAEGFLDSEVMKNCDSEIKSKNSDEFTSESYWSRPKVSFKVEHNKKDYKISPVHLSNPWSLMADCAGIWNMPKIIKRGVENANYIQAENVVTSFSEKESTIVIGDFNAPKKFFGGSSNSYNILSEAFGPSAIMSDQFTYDDPRRRFPSLSIDHAFVSSDLSIKKGEVLPFAGSDHLPIYLVVE